MNDNIVYAPVIIPTLCRNEHLKKCIESLRKNSWAKYTEIYIGLDYPQNDSHWDGYKKICNYLENEFPEFKKIIVLKRSKNFGVSLNFYSLVEEVFKKYDRFIFMEDDIEVSKNFLEYMDKCLAEYESNKDIVAINGYSYPLDWKISEGCNIFLSNFSCMMWGTGFWKKSFLEINSILKNGYVKNSFKNVNEKKLYKNLTDARLIDYINGCLDFTGKSFCDGFTDIAFSIYIRLENKYVVIPKISKVKNNGFDGTGVTCKDNAKNWKAFNHFLEKVDIETNFICKLDDNKDCSYNQKLMNKFDSRSFKDIFKIKIKLLFIKLFGIKFCKKILEYKNNYKLREN